MYMCTCTCTVHVIYDRTCTCSSYIYNVHIESKTNAKQSVKIITKTINWTLLTLHMYMNMQMYVVYMNMYTVLV